MFWVLYIMYLIRNTTLIILILNLFHNVPNHRVCLFVTATIAAVHLAMMGEADGIWSPMHLWSSRLLDHEVSYINHSEAKVALCRVEDMENNRRKIKQRSKIWHQIRGKVECSRRNRTAGHQPYKTVICWPLGLRNISYS